MKGIITDSIRYWESRRIVYNAALGAVVVWAFLSHHSPSAVTAVTWQEGVGLLLAAVMANLLYCSAYVVDVFVQMSEYQEAWKRNRWLLLGAGIILASAIYLLHD